MKIHDSDIKIMKKQIESLQLQLNEVDDDRRRCNLQVANVPEKRGENLTLWLNHVIYVDMQLPKTFVPDIEIIRRVGAFFPSQTRKIFIKFRDRSHKDTVWKNKKQLKGKHYHLLEDFCMDTTRNRRKLQPVVENLKRDGF